ncbi:MAG TPA: peptidoglycan DD-metalloendopeptidase family protein [Xanthomonadaceae bacterium]|nr:peptidoglycan DD-metalloendopeptidase family protein [Xanthomonadaceae bacterium]
MVERTTLRTLALLLMVALLAACSHARVIPEHGSGGVATRAGATTVVQRGDTLYGIAFRNGLDYRDVAAWNGIGPPYTIYPGQRLRLSGSPSGRRTASTRPSREPHRRPSSSTSTTRRPATPAVTLPTVAASGLSWTWPAQGRIISTFAGGDPTRQGIDIAGKRGDPVRAAADGVVVYSGSGLVGYGELVIVKHDESWLSAYGHNRARLVSEGAKVRAGQQIAEMGRTGADRDMLHFEIRHDGKPVDPQRYLPRK